MTPRFSIIVPLYNKAPYVRKVLESIVNQTFQDYEVIIVNDGSTDNSLDVVKELFERFKILDFRFKILNQENAGVAAARNNGVAKSKGEYLCFLDADDWWEKEYLEEMDRLIKEYPDAGLYATNYVYYKPGKTHVALDLERGYMNYPEAYLRGEMPVWTGAACMQRKVFDEMGGFPEGIKLGEDFLLWAKTALQYKVSFCEKPLAYYNNDVPAHLRATRNLHAPEHNMLFHLDSIEDAIHHTPYTIHQQAIWTQLLDKLRISGLMDYWLSEKYHDAAAEELKKVDWSKQTKKAKAQYEKPIWMIRAKRRFMQIGSYFKQKIIKLIVKSKELRAESRVLRFNS